MICIKPGTKFVSYSESRNGKKWKEDIYESIVHGTRKNLIPYNDLQRILVMSRGDGEVAAKKWIDKKMLPSNTDVLVDIHNRLCDLEAAVVELQEFLGINEN